MTFAARISLPLALLLAISSQAQPAPTEDQRIANDTAVRRAQDTILLHRKLEEAQAALKRKEVDAAAHLYLEAVGYIPTAEVGKPSVDADKRAAIAGLDSTESALARQLLEVGDVIEATHHVDVALRADPNNETLRRLRADIAEKAKEQAGRVPSPEITSRIPGIEQEKLDISTRVQNAKILYEMGKYDESEAILVEVMREDASNRTAPYYLDLIKEARYMDRARAREAMAKSAIGDVEAAWILSTNRDALPKPNPIVNSKLVYTTKGRQDILSKLDRIYLDDVRFDAPLSEVLNQLRTESQKRDPDGVGINFMFDPYPDAGSAGAAPTDITGAGGAGASTVRPTPVDPTQVTVKISPAMGHLRLADVLDAITKVADNLIRYNVEDYAVVFAPAPKQPEQSVLYSKVFKVDPNTFVQGLRGVYAISLNPGTISGGTGGAGGGGGGGGGGGQGGGEGGGQC